jgi:putative transcriptional regulator
MGHETLTNTVQDMRLERGLTQEELGRKIGVTRQTIIAIEKGNYTPSIVLCLKLATLFKVPVEKLFYL